MATKTAPKSGAGKKSYGLSGADREMRQLRAPAIFRGVAFMRFSGTRSSTTTGYGQLGVGGVDIFAKAAAITNVAGGASAENPFNNWLTTDAKPRNTLYPLAWGFYIGNQGDDTEKIKSIIIENSYIEIKQAAAVILRQPLLTMPPGLGIQQVVSQTTSNAAYYTEQHGEPNPKAVLRTKKGTVVLDKDTQLTAMLKTTAEAATYLAALSGSFANYQPMMGIVVYGTQELDVAKAV